MIAAIDLTGRGARDVLLATSKDGIYTVYLFRNETAAALSRKRPGGTGLNFTLY